MNRSLGRNANGRLLLIALGVQYVMQSPGSKVPRCNTTRYWPRECFRAEERWVAFVASDLPSLPLLLHSACEGTPM
jgi:hypothetical protein